jgi:flagellar biosynthesis/type III secretory pathway chaperone
MLLDWHRLMVLLRQECEIMGSLVAVLKREQLSLTSSDLFGLREAAGMKEALVPELGSLQKERRALAQAAAPGAKEPGLRSLVKAAPLELAGDLRMLVRRAADMGEQVFLLNRSNGQLLVQGRNVLSERMDALRYRNGRVVLYGPQAGMHSIGGTSVIDRDL